ncbi:fimbrial protein [Pseudomonas kribbensis]|uniref:fimbrial protein n=1 Tax=Pseudomonas kribbensis TaxID=1628086 RepID=UPI001F401583|nr:fimbrial protein [Pseudomonas kribbensis]UIN53868.1 fimbrial protein [Pseudomonas kribbensis]
MKFVLHIVVAFLSIVASTVATADNTAGCWWAPQTTNQRKFYFSLAMTPKTLNLAPIGQRMSYQAFNLQNLNSSIDFKCPAKINPIHYNYTVDAPLEDGYDDVYRTNLPGIGIRLVDFRLKKSLPFELSYINAARQVGRLPDPLHVELVRTARDIKKGDLNLNIKIHAQVEDWDAAEIEIVGQVEVISSKYFSGCTGEKRQDIPLGRVAIPLLEQQTPRTVGLSVLCSGLLPGSNLPVKVYFEGNNEGAGMLNLTPGGAEGIGVALTTPAGIKLPFSQWAGLPMQWIKSEEDGERYTFEFNAKYARKGSAKITPGRADAVLNYILDYN